VSQLTHQLEFSLQEITKFGNVRMTAAFYGLVRENGTSQITILVYNAAQSTGLSSTIPGTWTNNNNIQISYVALP
jgi:hypothetical protein